MHPICLSPCRVFCHVTRLLASCHLLASSVCLFSCLAVVFQTWHAFPSSDGICVRVCVFLWLSVCVSVLYVPCSPSFHTFVNMSLSVCLSVFLSVYLNSCLFVTSIRLSFLLLSSSSFSRLQLTPLATCQWEPFNILFVCSSPRLSACLHVTPICLTHVLFLPLPSIPRPFNCLICQREPFNIPSVCPPFSFVYLFAYRSRLSASRSLPSVAVHGSSRRLSVGESHSISSDGP